MIALVIVLVVSAVVVGLAFLGRNTMLSLRQLDRPGADDSGFGDEIFAINVKLQKVRTELDALNGLDPAKRLKSLEEKTEALTSRETLTRLNTRKIGT